MQGDGAQCVIFAPAGERGVEDTADIGGRDARTIFDEVDRTITPFETSVMSSREASACHAFSANGERRFERAGVNPPPLRLRLNPITS